MTGVKICGLRTLADVEKVNKYLPEYIGFVFANTRRFVTDEQARDMKQALDSRIKAVGVFVNEPIEHVINLCRGDIIDCVQLHGDESDEYIRDLKRETNTTVIKATKVQTAEQVTQLMSDEADYMLFDTYKKGELGGTGVRFPLEVLIESLDSLKADGRSVKPFFLAGGLDASNVREVLGQLGCYCVDVSTGVETDGVKDETKIKQFIENVRNEKTKQL